MLLQLPSEEGADDLLGPSPLFWVWSQFHNSILAVFKVKLDNAPICLSNRIWRKTVHRASFRRCDQLCEVMAYRHRCISFAYKLERQLRPVALYQAKAQACQRIDLMSIFDVAVRTLKRANKVHLSIPIVLVGSALPANLIEKPSTT